MSTKMSTTEALLYPEHDHEALGDYYLRHVSALTREDLHFKSAIAAQLAWRDKEIDRLNAALAQQAAVPAAPDAVVQGWKLVPIQPTPEMLAAPYDNECPNEAAVVYRAMLATAPTPPVDEELPPLPEPVYREGDSPSMGEVSADCYSTDQMQAYARTALQAVPQAGGLSDEAIYAEADKHGSRYRGPDEEGMTFDKHAVLDFARAILARAGAVEGGR